MSSTANPMGLTVWDLAADPYDHTQLAANMVAIANHDHTSGKGVQVPTGGLADAAVTQAKIANSAVGTSQLANSGVTYAKLGSDALTRLMPLGAVLPWWRPGAGTALPTGWVVADGSVITAGNHDFAGAGVAGDGSITLPNLRNKFLLGADTAGTGSGTSTPPSIGLTGGSHTQNLTHEHSIANHVHSIPDHHHQQTGHTHTVPNHTHTIPAHTHPVGAHTHSIASGGAHSHNFEDEFGTNTNLLIGSRVIDPAGINGTVFHTIVPGLLNTGDLLVESGGTHTHGGATGGPQGSTATDANTVGLATDSSGSVATGGVAEGTQNTADATSLSTNNPTSNPSTTGGGLSSTFDTRPAYAGLLFIVKVKF